jgi:hypothetical protein
VAIAPWALWFAHSQADFKVIYKDYPVLLHAAIIGLAVILGSVFEGAVSHLEARWDKQRDKEWEVRKNWFYYLAQKSESEPIGFKYMGRMVTTMYFELSMMVASPISLTGVAVLAYANVQSFAAAWSALFILAAVALAVFFWWQAKCSHLVLCETRKEINARGQAER